VAEGRKVLGWETRQRKNEKKRPGERKTTERGDRMWEVKGTVTGLKGGKESKSHLVKKRGGQRQVHESWAGEVGSAGDRGWKGLGKQDSST